MKFKIESNVEIPAYKTTEIQEVLKEMKIGDSFSFSNEEANVNYIEQQARLMGIKISRRSLEGKTGYRVWRIK